MGDLAEAKKAMSYSALPVSPVANSATGPDFPCSTFYCYYNSRSPSFCPWYLCKSQLELSFGFSVSIALDMHGQHFKISCYLPVFLRIKVLPLEDAVLKEQPAFLSCLAPQSSISLGSHQFSESTQVCCLLILFLTPFRIFNSNISWLLQSRLPLILIPQPELPCYWTAEPALHHPWLAHPGPLSWACPWQSPEICLPACVLMCCLPAF